MTIHLFGHGHDGGRKRPYENLLTRLVSRFVKAALDFLGGGDEVLSSSDGLLTDGTAPGFIRRRVLAIPNFLLGSEEGSKSPWTKCALHTLEF